MRQSALCSQKGRRWWRGHEGNDGWPAGSQTGGGMHSMGMKLIGSRAHAQALRQAASSVAGTGAAQGGEASHMHSLPGRRDKLAGRAPRALSHPVGGCHNKRVACVRQAAGGGEDQAHLRGRGLVQQQGGDEMIPG